MTVFLAESWDRSPANGFRTLSVHQTRKGAVETCLSRRREDHQLAKYTWDFLDGSNEPGEEWHSVPATDVYQVRTVQVEA